MGPFDEFAEIVQPSAPLAPLTWLRLGGPAEYLARPRDRAQLRGLLARAWESGLPVHILSGGSNILVPDAGVPGLVVHLESPAFSDVTVEGREISTGAAVPLTALISQTARAGLSGLEVLTGIPGTVGGALRNNSGSRQGSIGQFVRSVTVMDASGEVVVREHDDLSFGYRWSNLDDPVILSAVFALEPDDPEAVVRRMRRTWILKKENQPYGHQSSSCVFKDPAPDISARAVLDQAGLKGTRLGAAEVSDRHANYIIAEPGATAADVLALIEQIRRQVHDQYGYDLEPQIKVW